MKNLSTGRLICSNFFERFSSYLFPIFVFTFAFQSQYSVAFLGLDLHHDLFMFDAARNLYSGQVPFKDFFYQYNLGTVFLHGSTLALFGLKISALKKITILFYALIALLIYLSCAVEGFRRSGFLLSILWALLSPFYMPAMNGYHAWPTIYMMFTCMAGLFCIQLATQKSPLAFSFFAGAFFCLAFWFKQVAAFQIIAIVIWLAFNIWSHLRSESDHIKYIKIFAGYTIGGLVLSVPFFSYLYIESAILDWWISAFEFNKYFASDSQNATGIGASLKIFLPITRDLGYKSVFWALCPIILCVATFQAFIWQRTSFKLSKPQKENIALFSLAGLAGWVAYFPLPHPFHTQIFMAPTFVLIGILLGKHPVSYREIKKNFLIFFSIYIFIVCGSYESIRHIIGWNQKRLEYKKDSIKVNLGSVFDGLKIDGNTEKSLTQFYGNLIDLKNSSESGDFIPLSVDPIRGLLPGEIVRPSEFKMGVNWTWPNELVEPGFSNKTNSQIRLALQPIYADSLIYIPGYIPIGLLKMRSPISGLHTLYKPGEGTSKLIEEVKKSNEILYITDKEFDLKSRSILFDWNTNQKVFNLIPLDGLSEQEIKSIQNIHISVIEKKDLPYRLSGLQLEYLKNESKYYDRDLSALFRLDTHGDGVLRDNINEEDVKNLAFFMLSTGKLFVSQNRPVYSSTFELKYQERPFIVRYSEGDTYLQMLWGMINDHAGQANKAIYSDRPTQIYLATKPLTNKEGSKFIIVQIELKNLQMKNYFYSFLDDKK